MPQSLTNLLVHIVFSTKDRYRFLEEETIRRDMHSFLGGICRNANCPAITIGGPSDHVHLLCAVHKSMSVSTLVGDIKRISSTWVKDKGGMLTKFHWQNGYGAFSVSCSNVDAVREYIDEQIEHHRGHTFQEEFRTFLKKHQVGYDERYIWD